MRCCRSRVSAVGAAAPRAPWPAAATLTERPGRRAQARKLSVKRVTATEILDRQGNAVPDGLYDPAMGPTDPKGAPP